uniref:ABC transporter substrate-binding protein n=1 Tax=Eubacterium cellulosolvens TaxID=29322 RepID=UPI0006854BBD|nr:ABC transporter substrate-binding protein [[Eubacterium] cellulosolvens]
MKALGIKKWIRSLAVVTAFVTAASFAGCGTDSEAKSLGSGSDSGAEASGKTEDGKDLTEMKVILDWYPNAIHTFLYDAEEKGYFAEEGIKVTIIPPAQSVDAVTFVSTGKADIGLTYPIETVKAAEAEDIHIHAIGSVTQETLTCMASLKDGGVQEIKDLKGKKVGYDGTASSEAMVRTVAKAAGLSEDDYEMVNVGFELTTALTTKSVDVVAGIMINDEVITMENNGYELNVFSYDSNGVPEMYDIVMVAEDKAYEDNPELYKGFLRACAKGFEDMKASEEDALDLIMDKMNSDESPLDREQQKGSYETLLPYMEHDDAKFLSMTDEKWQNYIDWMKKCGLVEKDVKPADVYIAPELD